MQDDPSAGAVVANGIVAQVEAQLLQQALVALYGQVLALGQQGNVGLLGVQGQALGAAAGQRQQGHRGELGLLRCLPLGGFAAHVVQLAQLDDVGHQRLQAGGLGADAPGEYGHILRLGHAGFDQLGVTGNAGERGFQLVAHVGGEFPPHALVVLAQQPVALNCLGKGHQLGVGHMILDVLQILAHLHDGPHQAAGEQPAGQHAQHQNDHAADHDGRQGLVEKAVGAGGVQPQTKHISALHPQGAVIGAVADGAAFPLGDAHAVVAVQGLLHLRAFQMVFQHGAGGTVVQNAAVLRNEGNAQRILSGNFQNPLIASEGIAACDRAGGQLQIVLHLMGKTLVKHKNGQSRGEHQAHHAHKQQPVVDGLLNAPFHSAVPSSSGRARR